MEKTKNKRVYKQAGFTLIELVLVFLLIGIISAFLVPVLLDDFVESELKDAQYQIVDRLRVAQANSMFGKGNSEWGVHFDTTSMTFFKGSTYNPVDPDNEVIAFGSTVSLSGISLNGGGDDLIYNKVYGDTDEYGTITILESNSGNTRTVTVNEVGMVDYQILII